MSGPQRTQLDPILDYIEEHYPDDPVLYILMTSRWMNVLASLAAYAPREFEPMGIQDMRVESDATKGPVVYVTFTVVGTVRFEPKRP